MPPAIFLVLNDEAELSEVVTTAAFLALKPKLAMHGPTRLRR
jgi:hypothetical protein